MPRDLIGNREIFTETREFSTPNLRGFLIWSIEGDVDIVVLSQNDQIVNMCGS